MIALSVLLIMSSEDKTAITLSYPVDVAIDDKGGYFDTDEEEVFDSTHVQLQLQQQQQQKQRQQQQQQQRQYQQHELQTIPLNPNHTAKILSALTEQGKVLKCCCYRYKIVTSPAMRCCSHVLICMITFILILLVILAFYFATQTLSVSQRVSQLETNFRQLNATLVNLYIVKTNITNAPT